jgi:hypothetical protein
MKQIKDFNWYLDQFTENVDAHIDGGIGSYVFLSSDRSHSGSKLLE